MKGFFKYLLPVLLLPIINGCHCPEIKNSDRNRVNLRHNTGEEMVYIKADHSDTISYKIVRYEDVKGNPAPIDGGERCSKHLGYKLVPQRTKDSLLKGWLEYSQSAPSDDYVPPNISLSIQFSCSQLNIGTKKDPMSGNYLPTSDPAFDSLHLGAKTYYSVFQEIMYLNPYNPACRVNRVYYEFGKDVFAFYLDNDTIVPYLLQ